jgi:hypothetical protein
MTAYHGCDLSQPPLNFGQESSLTEELGPAPAGMEGLRTVNQLIPSLAFRHFRMAHSPCVATTCG